MKRKCIKISDPMFRYLLDFDPGFEAWRVLVAEWATTKKLIGYQYSALGLFFIDYLHKLQLSKNPPTLLNKNHSAPSLWEGLQLHTLRNEGSAKDKHDTIVDFIDWILRTKFSETNAQGHRIVPSHLRNPFPRQRTKLLGKTTDSEFRYLLDIDPEFEAWRVLVTEWATTKKLTKKQYLSLGDFFVGYLHKLQLNKNPATLLNKNHSAPSLWEGLQLHTMGKQFATEKHDTIVDFIDWVLNQKFSETNAQGHRIVPSHLRNPFPRRQTKVLGKTKDPKFRYLQDFDPELEAWRVLAAEWATTKKLTRIHYRSLGDFFVGYLHKLQLNKNPVTLLNKDHSMPSLWEGLQLDTLGKLFAAEKHDTIVDFIDWVLNQKFSETNAQGHRIVPSHLRNPFPRQRKKSLGKTTDGEFHYLLDIDPEFEAWRVLAAEWVTAKKLTKKQYLSLGDFFFDYLHKLQLSKNPEILLNKNHSVPSLWEGLQLDTLRNEGGAKGSHDTIVDFIDWVLNQKFSETNAQGHRIVPSHLRNPFPRRQTKVLGKSSDIELRHLTEYDPSMEDWRSIGSEWFNEQRSGSNSKLIALNKFLRGYIAERGLDRNPYNYLRRDALKPRFIDVLLASRCDAKDHIENSKPSRGEIKTNNHISDFLDWILHEKLSAEDDNGERVIPAEFHNPVSKLANKGGQALSETMKMSLPYRYIKELRKMLAQGPTFRDWTWAQQAMSGRTGGDWFMVDPTSVNPNDPDCVWRSRKTTRNERRDHGLPEEVIELWSPVRAVALYLKLELPLRTFQVRMLDSGEADTWRYEAGSFRLSHSLLASGSEKRPSQRGVFHYSSKGAKAGIYINTNKTADINKDENDKGYVIPWSYEPVLFWLEKLRDWQERYNPIESPTPWRELDHKHFGYTPHHFAVLDSRSDACFLFRDAAAEDTDRRKPLCSGHLEKLWYKLLFRLEGLCNKNHETLENGAPIRFVARDSKKTTLYSLHSLRVSLITAYVLEGGVPFEVVSKLIVGHSRIIMTLHYTKMGKAFVTEILAEAEKKMLENERANYKRFLMEKTYQDIEQQFVFVSPDGLKACQQQKSAAGFIIEDKGICPVGGGLCDVGGEEISSRGEASVYAPVPGYPQERNCICCRFFLTGPAFLPGLQARFNQISYETTECSHRFVQLEQKVKVLEDAQYECRERDQPFTQAMELQRIHQRYEAEAEKANKLLTDMQMCTRLIDRVITLANSTNKNGMRLVANGGISDFQYALVETTSEMHQLEVICENAVIYPEIDASKAILRRSQILDIMLELNSRPPIFCRLSPDQQQKVGNELMKLIQARTGSLKEAVEFAEGRRKLQDLGILQETTGLIDELTAGVSFRKFMSAARTGKLMTIGSVEKDDDIKS